MLFCALSTNPKKSVLTDRTMFAIKLINFQFFPVIQTMLPDGVICKQSPLWETTYDSQHFNTIFCLFFVYLNFLSEFCCFLQKLDIELNCVMRHCYLIKETTVTRYSLHRSYYK